jgi:hypothetical protein
MGCAANLAILLVLFRKPIIWLIAATHDKARSQTRIRSMALWVILRSWRI